MLDFVIKSLIIDSYRNMITSMKIISLREKIHKTIRVYNATIVLSYLSIVILVYLRDKCKINLLRSRNFMFMLIKLSNCFELNEDVLNYIINVNMCAI
jgi:hypothetical protein